MTRESLEKWVAAELAHGKSMKRFGEWEAKKIR
jgi:hypothetical protein